MTGEHVETTAMCASEFFRTVHVHSIHSVGGTWMRSLSGPWRGPVLQRPESRSDLVTSTTVVRQGRRAIGMRNKSQNTQLPRWRG